MTNPTAKTATDRKGQRVRVGDTVRAINPRDEKPTGPAVRVVSIHRQGFDGTILTTDPAPEPEYPHHFSRAAKYCVRIDEKTADRARKLRRESAIEDAATALAREIVEDFSEVDPSKSELPKALQVTSVAESIRVLVSRFAR